MSHMEPMRIVLRLHEDYWQEEQAIIDQFFQHSGIDPQTDFFSHLRAPNESVMMHIILDLYCQRHPSVDLGVIKYQVFKVKKKDDLYVAIWLSLNF